MNWKSKFLPLKVASEWGSGTIAYASLQAVTNAIAYVNLMVDRGYSIPVITGAWMFSTNPSDSGHPSSAGLGGLSREIDRAGDRNITVVVAAQNNSGVGPTMGNLDDPNLLDEKNNHVNPMYPVAWHKNNVIVVAATTQSDAIASFQNTVTPEETTGTFFSNFGESSVQIAAPGYQIYTTKNLSTVSNGTTVSSFGYDEAYGSSLAMPMVAGTASLMLALKPDLTISQIRTALQMSVDKPSALLNKVQWDGRLNSAAALKYVKDNYLDYGYDKVYIGDTGGNPKNDTFYVFKKTSSTGVVTTGVTKNGVAQPDVSPTASLGIFGLGGNDYIEVSSSVNNPVYINGGTGNDTIVGGNGNDTLIGENGDDSITAGSGDDDVSGGNGIDYIDGGAGKDTLHGNSDYDYILGGSGNDQIFGDDGDDRLFGGADNDSIRGGIGADTLYGDSGADTVYGDDGDDRFFSNHDMTHDELHGGLGVDKVSAAEIDTVATGGQAADLVDSITVI